jgi:ribosomal protein S18 acetylase RimI-like enzyme
VADAPPSLIRRGSPTDVPFMRSMLAHAYHWRVNALEADIPLTRYVEAWGREGDVALIATERGHRVGAAWFRLFPASAPGYGFVDEETPELTIAIVPSRRGRGLGEELLSSLLEQARKEGRARISLSVEPDNPAIRLYEQHGFAKVGERAGAWVMLATLA